MLFKKFAILLLTTIFSLQLAADVKASASPSVYLDGERLAFSTNPIIKNGSTLVPMRLIFEKQGASVDWNNTTKTVTAKKGATTIVYTIGSKQAKVNQTVFTLHQAGEIRNGNTLVPLRFVSESLGNVVGWEEKSKTVIISSAKMVSATVTRVIDGDTIEVKLADGTTEKVRMIGIDTPESVHPDASNNTEFGTIASNYTKSQLLNKKVMLEFDVGERDQYNRLLAYVYKDSLMYNAKLAAEGYAHQMTYQPNVRWTNLFQAMVNDARSNDRGLWAYDAVDGSEITGTTGKLVIDNVDYKGEIVAITNKDSKSVNMSGWKLVSIKGNQVYNFPDGFQLASGKTVYVTSGPNAKEGNGYLKWTTANVHNNDGQDPTELYDMNGTLISSFGK